MLTNFSYSILQLFIKLQEDIVAFLSTTSRKATVVCSQFKRIWVDESISFNQKYAFWRPQAPPGFVVLGDCVTPVDEPPSKGVLALNTSFAKVKRPLHFELVWSSSDNYCSDREQIKLLESDIRETDVSQCSHDNPDQSECRVWMPIPPEGYVALGCVVSRGREQTSLSSSLCVSAALVTPCPLKDCVLFSYPQLNFERKMHAFWRVDNYVGSFLPRQSETGQIKWKAYDFRYVVFGYNQECANPSMQKPAHGSNSIEEVMKLESPEPILSSQRYQNVAEFELVWWNRGNSAKRKVSIWRPILPPGCFYVGDIAVPRYKPLNMVLVLRDLIDGTVLRSPLDLKQVGHIDKRRGMDSVSFWFPQAPPGYVSLGCIASKSTMKPEETTLLRCVRSDLVSGGQFPDNSIWDTTEIKHTREGFSIWTLDNELGTFIVRNGFKRPPKRFGLRLADQRISGEPDDLVVDAEVGGLSATLFDDFGGLMAPLLNVSLTGITLSLHGRFDNLNSTLNLSLMARSYNEKDGSWEPLIEPMDGFIRYQYDKSGSGAPSQIRMASTKDLNMNLSVSNVNMFLEAFSSWNRLNEMKGSSKIKVQDVNLTIGVSGQPGESIIQDVSGLSRVIRRSLRDLWHQIPNIEAAIKIEELKATMLDKECEIITECAMTNMSETPNNPPLLDNVVETSPGHEIEHENSELPHMASGESSTLESWVTIKVTVDINLVELSLYTGRSRDAPLATTQISGMWLLYKSTSDEESLIMVTLKNFSVTDDHEGTILLKFLSYYSKIRSQIVCSTQCSV